MADDTIKIAIEAVDNASATFEKVGDEVEKLGARGEEAGAGAAKGAQGFESFAGKLVAVQAGVSIAQEAIGGLKQVWDFAKEGAENQRIAESFQRTAKSIGANADDIVAKLDDAAKGTVDDEELMQASTRALTLGVAKSGDDLVNVMKLARGAALQFGGDAGSAFENINQAIGNLAPRALKQYGIIVSLKEANEKYAKSIGVTADSLTEEQQRQALLNEVLIQGAKNFGDIGNSAATTGEKMKALETRAANLIDVLKETAATGFTTAFNITDAPKNALEAFTGTADKMRKEVAEGRMSVKDYNDALKGMASAIAPLVTGALADAALKSYSLDASFEKSTTGAYGLAGGLDESARADRRAADAAAALEKQNQLLAQAQSAATTGAYGQAGALDESERAMRRANESTARLTATMDALKVGLAGQVKNEIDSFNKKQDELKAKASELQGVIESSYGKARDSAVTNLAEINKQLGDNAAAHEEATRRILFGYAEQQLAVNGLTETEAGALDALAEKWGIKSKEDIAAMQAIRDAAAGLAKDNSIETFVKKLDSVSNKALDIKITPEIDYKNFREAKLDKAITVPIKPVIVAADNAKLAHDLAGDLKYTQPVITPKVDAAQAAKDIQAYTTDKVGAIPKEKTTKAIFDTATATTNANAIIKLFNVIPKEKNTEIGVDGKQALQTLDDVIRDLGNIFSKTIEIKVKYTQTGERPSGFAHGVDMIVPPSSTGTSGDYYPFLAAAGERVTVTPAAQQKPATVQSGDTYNYTTNVYNPLAAAMLADKQRRDRLARSNSRMGVT